MDAGYIVVSTRRRREPVFEKEGVRGGALAVIDKDRPRPNWHADSADSAVILTAVYRAGLRELAADQAS